MNLTWTKSSLCLLLVLEIGCFAVTAGAAKNIYHQGWTDFNKNGTRDVYEDASQPIQKRVDNLLSQMTTNEKTMQLVTLYGYTRVLKDALPTKEWDQELWKEGLCNIDEQHNGIERSYGHYDWPASLHADTINKTQRWFIENTRLGIPVDFTNEGIRGICQTNGTNFPAQIAMGATWDKDLVYRTGRVTAKEGYVLGYTTIYSPIIDVPQDPRWGRMVECYGESPFLVAELGVQQAKGIRSEKMGVTCKCFAVYGVPNGGRDGHARTDPKVTPRELEMVHLYTFEQVIKRVGIQGVMSSYNDWDGLPISGSSRFLIDILRKGMGFEGYVTSDSGAVEFMNYKHKVEPTYKDTVRRFIMSGGNVNTTFVKPDMFIVPLRELIKEGVVPMEVIDDRVRDVLKVKFELGIFDHPYRDPELADRWVAPKEHKKVALEAARKSLVLLKNEHKLLPLSKENVQSILVTGPGADDTDICRSRYGPKHSEVISVLEGIKKIYPGQVVYKKGCSHHSLKWPQTEIMSYPIDPKEEAMITDAVAAAQKCDVVIAVLGDSEDMVGESRSRSSLDLPPLPQQFIQRLSREAGKPVVVVLLNGRAMSVNWINAYCPAILEGWFGGEFMGQAVAEALFGDYNPGGKLPVTFPKTVGQIPLHIGAKPFSFAGQGKKGDPNGTGNSRIMGPLYPFGYGLSYTTFQYKNLTVSANELTADQTLTVTCQVSNTGQMAGDEVVQLYINDKISSVTTYERILRGFERVHLAPGQTKTVTFTLQPKEHFWLINENKDRVVEPGKFEIAIGASSRAIKLKQDITIIGKTVVVGKSLLAWAE